MIKHLGHREGLKLLVITGKPHPGGPAAQDLSVMNGMRWYVMCSTTFECDERYEMVCDAQQEM